MGNVTLAGGTIKALNVNPGGTGANITVQNGSMVEAMLVSAPAAIEVEGSVQNITLLQGAQGAVVSGEGTVGQASVLAENVQVTTPNTNILVDPSVTNTEGIPSGYQTGAVNVPASGTDGNKTEGTGGGSGSDGGNSGSSGGNSGNTEEPPGTDKLPASILSVEAVRNGLVRLTLDEPTKER